MAKGMQHLIFICVAFNPLNLNAIGYITNWANGSSFLVFDELSLKMGLASWDATAMLIWMVVQHLVPPLSYFSVRNLAQRLEHFASSFNAKFKHLVSAGKV